MRTLIMLGIAASAVIAADRAAAAEVPMATGVSLSDGMIAQGHKKKRDATLDYGAGYPGDARVYSGGADRYPVEGEYRRVDDVDYQGRWTGTWNGTYETPDGHTYDGEYQGSYDGQAGTSYAPPHGDPYAHGYRTGMEQRHGASYGYDPRHDERMARLCRDDGLGGGVIGGVIGGVAGNRIAGRGNRTAGTLIGAGVGGVIGAVIDQNEDKQKCAAWRASRQRYSQGGYPGGYYPGGHAPAPYPHHQGGSHGQVYHHGGYGYYSPGVVVTTIITPAAPVTTTETVTTTTTHYETVYSSPRKRYAPKKRVYRPRPKPRCGC